MKISIKSQPYGITPKPVLTKAMFDWFWDNFHKVRNAHQSIYNPIVITDLKIRINQALSWMPLHFYIRVNGQEEFHIECPLYQIKQWQIEKEKLTKEFDTDYRSRKYNFNKWCLNK